MHIKDLLYVENIVTMTVPYASVAVNQKGIQSEGVYITSITHNGG